VNWCTKNCATFWATLYVWRYADVIILLPAAEAAKKDNRTIASSTVHRQQLNDHQQQMPQQPEIIANNVGHTQAGLFTPVHQEIGYSLHFSPFYCWAQGCIFLGIRPPCLKCLTPLTDCHKQIQGWILTPCRPSRMKNPAL